MPAFGFHPVLEILAEARAADYAVVARLTTRAFKRLLPGLGYESVNPQWEMAELEYRPHGWPQAHVVSWWREDSFRQKNRRARCSRWGAKHVPRLGNQHMDLTLLGSLALLRWACRHGTLESANCVKTTPSARFPLRRSRPNALYLEIVRLAYNSVTAFQRNCLEESWQSLPTLQKLRYKLFLLLRVNSLARRTAQSFASGSRRNYRIWLRAFSAKSTD